jgi:Glycosyltransferase Family 4
MVTSRTVRRRHDVTIYLPTVGPLLSRVPGHAPGGAEVQMLLVARGLAELGARVCIVAGGDPGSMLDEIDGVEVVWRSPYRLGAPMRGKLAEFREIYASIAAGDADVVVAMTAVPATALIALSARLQQRSFVYATASDSDFARERLETKRRNVRLFHSAIRLADLVIVQNERQRGMCEARFGRSSLVIRSVAEPGELRTSAPEAFLWAGRVISYKRPLAYVALARAVPEARFWMLGIPQGGEADQRLLSDLRRAAHGVPNLELLDPRPRCDVMALLERAVAIVNTSEFEGLSNTFLEAWSRGVPALSLSHDPDGLIERCGLGGFAHGSETRLASLVHEFWRLRGDQHELAGRCHLYVLDNHRPATIYKQWFDALRVPRATMATEPAAAGASR